MPFFIPILIGASLLSMIPSFIPQEEKRAQEGSAASVQARQEEPGEAQVPQGEAQAQQARRAPQEGPRRSYVNQRPTHRDREAPQTRARRETLSKRPGVRVQRTAHAGVQEGIRRTYEQLAQTPGTQHAAPPRELPGVEAGVGAHLPPPPRDRGASVVTQTWYNQKKG